MSGLDGLEAAGNHGPSAVQGSTIKQHAIEVLEHTHTPHHIINNEIPHIVDFNERIPTLQK